MKVLEQGVPYQKLAYFFEVGEVTIIITYYCQINILESFLRLQLEHLVLEECSVLFQQNGATAYTA